MGMHLGPAVAPREPWALWDGHGMATVMAAALNHPLMKHLLHVNAVRSACLALS